MTAWAAGKAACAALYLAYVALGVGVGWPLAIVALATAAGALAVGLDPVRLRGALAAGTLVLAVLHARLAPGAPWAPIQLGLAAAVAASSAATLLAQRTGGRAAASPAITFAVGLAVVASGAAAGIPAAPGLALVAFAALRPLGALGVVLGALGWHAGPRDPLLTWRPLTSPGAAPPASPPRSPEVAR